MSNVRLRNLCVSLGDKAVIQDLNLFVREGEFLVLLGPSGCGKSTLLHSIAGLAEVASGSVEIDGKDMTHADPSVRGIGMVFQSYALYPTMSVEKNMSFGLRIKGTPKAEIERRIKRTAEMLHLEPLLRRKPSQLSGGQRQRVAIGRALVRDAGMFLFDEPLSNLDAKLRAELRRELKLLHQTLHATMIYVTHDQVEAMTLATRIVVMRDGEIQQIGSPVEVYERPASLFVAGFLGAPAMNFISGILRANRIFTAGSLDLNLRDYSFAECHSADRPVILGVRAEHIQIDQSGPFSGTITLIETMGNHQIVWFESAGELLGALVHDTRVFRLGDMIRFTMDANRVSLFDKNIGRRL